MLTIKGYYITEEIYQSSNSLVYRGYRIEDKQAVILKILNQADPSPERMASFKREYEITRQLDLPGVVKAFSLEYHQKHYIMILEDFGGQSLASLQLAGQFSLTAWLRLAIKIVKIIGKIHSRHIIHKDINPANIILNPERGEVKMIDFGISTVLSHEKATFGHVNVLQGTLAYISPEQTGRINRAIDYRTDFYSLGVTFYHLLTGKLPFVSQDALELVHSHIAKPFTLPHSLKPEFPAMISEIISKLMSKNAEERYQSAYGLKADLEQCLRQWQSQKAILPFQLGQDDISEPFQISQELSGRPKESADWHVGQLLLAQRVLNEQEERIFEIVNQLKQGRAIGKSPIERQKLGKLNLLELNERLAAGCLNKLILCYLFEEYSQAATYATKAQEYLSLAIGMQTAPIFNFYESLTCLALYPSVDFSQQKELLARVAANQEKMAFWVEHAPMNHQHKFYLVEAERARLANENGKAREYYDQAIELAAQHQYTNEEALANELAAQFYFSKERIEIANLYLRHAHYAYQRWGAVTKVKALERRFPKLLNDLNSYVTDKTTIILRESTTTTNCSGSLDLTSVLKASQAISGEIVLETLLSKLIEIVLENAGAERGFLILPHKDKWLIQAAGEVNQGHITVLQAIPLEELTLPHAIPILSHAIVNVVIRTQESVVLNNALHEGQFTHESYIMTKQPKSILCAPLLNQGQLTGILYLENNLTTGAFTDSRLQVLNLLSSQAAIAIENAQLYSNIRALNKAYERFVPRQFLSFLEKDSIIDVKLGDQVQKEMTILFSDIRDFTSLSEKMTPTENFRFVNGYLSRMEPIIIESHGFIDKYIGDSIMALFPTNADDALEAAISMSRQLKIYNQTRQEPERPPLKIGIGLHTGLLMLGTVGGHNRMDGTVISDAVNLGARVEGLTKLYGVTLLITQQTYASLQKPSGYAIREIARVAVKGKSEPVTVLEVLDADQAEQKELKEQTLSDFEQALALYRQREFMAAHALFKQVWRQNPQDHVARLYIKRCLEQQRYRLPADWNGVDVLTTK